MFTGILSACAMNELFSTEHIETNTLNSYIQGVVQVMGDGYNFLLFGGFVCPISTLCDMHVYSDLIKTPPAKYFFCCFLISMLLEH